MSHYNARVPANQQYQLIMECRNSGLTDYQWCKEHGIHPGTFYNWVSRLRKKACYDIPAPASRDSFTPSDVQEVVKLDFPDQTKESDLIPLESCQPVSAQSALRNPVIEISLGQAIIRISNGTEPAMLNQILSLVKAAVC